MINLAVVGAGHVVVSHLDVISAIPNARVVAITSRTKEKAANLAKRYDIKCVYDDLDQMMASSDVDAVLNLVSADQIYHVSKQVLHYKCPLFVEKPAGLSFEENRELIAIAKQHNILFMIGYNRRFYSVFRKGMELIRQHGPLLGVSVEGHERFWKIKELIRPELRGRWLYANSCHTIDLLSFFGGEVECVNVFKSSLVESAGDQFIASLRFKSGALGQYVSHWYSPGGWAVKLYGKGITVKFEPLEKGIWIDSDFTVRDVLPDEIDVNFKPGYYAQMASFVDMVAARQTISHGFDIQLASILQQFAECDPTIVSLTTLS